MCNRRWLYHWRLRIFTHEVCILKSQLATTGWRRPIECLLSIGHFPQKSPTINGSFAKRVLQLKTSCAFSPPCKLTDENKIENVSTIAISYVVATLGRLLKIIGLFCKRALWKRLYSAKETYSFKGPTNRSHHIARWLWKCIPRGWKFANISSTVISYGTFISNLLMNFTDERTIEGKKMREKLKQKFTPMRYAFSKVSSLLNWLMKWQ